MKRKRFTEEQIVRVPQEAEALENVRDLCRKHNISEQTFYRWHNKHAGMDVTEARRVKELERENTELKKLVGDMLLNNPCSRMCRERSGEPGCQALRG